MYFHRLKRNYLLRPWLLWDWTMKKSFLLFYVQDLLTAVVAELYKRRYQTVSWENTTRVLANLLYVVSVICVRFIIYLTIIEGSEKFTLMIALVQQEGRGVSFDVYGLFSRNSFYSYRCIKHALSTLLLMIDLHDLNFLQWHRCWPIAFSKNIVLAYFQLLVKLCLKKPQQMCLRVNTLCFS